MLHFRGDFYGNALGLKYISGNNEYSNFSNPDSANSTVIEIAMNINISQTCRFNTTVGVIQL